MSASSMDPQKNLFKAAFGGDVEGVVEALRQGASPWVEQKDGLTPLKAAAISFSSNSLPCVLALMQAENDQPRGQLRSFCDLAWLKVKKIWCQESGQSIENFQNGRLLNSSRSAFHWAIRSNQPEVALALMDHCDPAQPDLGGEFPLTEAASRVRMEEVVRRLLTRVDPKVQDSNGNTPLMRAAEVESMESIRLLAPLSDLSAVNAKGETALCAAIGGTGTARSVDFLSTASNDAILAHAVNLLETKEGQEPHFGIDRPESLNLLRVKLEARRIAKAASNPSPAAPSAPRAGL